MLTKVRNHGLTPQSILLDFLRSNFWSYHWTEHLMSAIYTCWNLNVQNASWGRDLFSGKWITLCVFLAAIFLGLSTSLLCGHTRLPCQQQRWGMGKEAEVDELPGLWRNPKGSSSLTLHTSCPTGGHLCEIPRQKKKKDWFGTFLKQIIFFFYKGGMTKK